MSREIKFRAWNPYQDRMIGGYSFSESLGMFPAQCHEHLMQYTGLTDKNGVEIYEGDNLRIQEYGVWQNYHVKDMVSFWLDLYAEFGGFEPDSNTMEVVGNIY